MDSILVSFHMILAVLLIALVLIQDSKGGATGGIWGGAGSSGLLSSTGAASLLVRLTRWIAALFGVSCVVLVLRLSSSSDSVVDSIPASSSPAPVAAPARSNDATSASASGEANPAPSSATTSPSTTPTESK